MAHTDPVELAEVISLNEGDAADGLLLSTNAGWDQTIHDWRLLLGRSHGVGVRSPAGKLVATGIALPYSANFGWIGMILVDASHRRQGFATRLLSRLTSELIDKGLVPMLDATPAGKPVYESLGFAAIEGISRWRRAGSTTVLRRHQALEDLQKIAALDCEAFGADRISLLHSLADRADSAVVVDADCSGYAVCRQGRTGTHIGPIVTRDLSRLPNLITATLKLADGPVIADIPDRATLARDTFRASGFTIERALTRMALGRNQAFGTRGMVAATAGPEFG